MNRSQVRNLINVRTAPFSGALILVGATLLLGSIGFAVFAEMSRSKADRYTASVPVDDRLAGWVAPGSGTFPVSAEGGGFEVARFLSLYPGGQINPKYWNDPDWSGPEPFSGPKLPEGYELVTRPGQGLPGGASAAGVRIRIPSIALSEVIEELDVIVEGDTPHYEQPIRIVGHIRETPNPGENGNGWYFGHQSNFGSNEGAVFRRIPEIFDQFKKDPVYIYVDTNSGSFAYQVFGTDVEDREKLRITTADSSMITLVTSWPPHVFDQRFLVFAELVGIKQVQ